MNLLWDMCNEILRMVALFHYIRMAIICGFPKTWEKAAAALDEMVKREKRLIMDNEKY